MVLNATFVSKQYFSYIVTVSFIAWGNHCTRRKPPTCRKSLTNFITLCCIEYTSPWEGFKLATFVVIGTHLWWDSRGYFWGSFVTFFLRSACHLSPYTIVYMYRCVRGINFASVSTIFRLGVETVTTVQYFLIFFILWQEQWWRSKVMYHDPFMLAKTGACDLQIIMYII
jgi:hypothetical protein